MRLAFANALKLDPENWQMSLFSLVLRVSTFFGALVFVPSLLACFKSGFWGLAVIDTVALGTVGILFWFDRRTGKPVDRVKGLPRFRFRAIIFCSVLYSIALGLMIWVGPISQIFLFGFSTFTTLLLGLRAGLFSALLSSATLFTVGTIGIAAAGMLLQTDRLDTFGWFVITLNFTLVNTMLTLAIGAVIEAMNRALEREVASRISLERERTVLRTLVDTLPDVIFTKDKDGRFINANEATLKLIGLHREDELAGKTDFDFFPRELAKSYTADETQVLAGKALQNREFRVDGPAGKGLWYLTIKVPLRDPAGNIVGLIGIGRDITDRKQAESERDNLLTRLQLQIERMPLAYLLSDADFRYTRWNPAAEKIFGFKEAEVLGKHPFDVIVPTESQGVVGEIFQKIRAGSMDSHGECENRTKDGRTITCEWHNTPMYDDRGAFIGLMSLANNITQRKDLEAQLRQSQKMDAIGRLAGGIAHDFNNLLTIISGYSELLLTTSGLRDDFREPVTAISEAGERAAALTRQLLGFSRQTLLQPKVLDLNSVVSETGKMLRRLIGEDIVFTTVLDPKLSLVKVDPSQLDQILMNLAVNARDAMPTGGLLTIETSNVLVSDEDLLAHLDCHPGHYVQLAMSDTGCGMTPDVMARIFEPFYTTKEVGKGTGLGLAMVFGIVQQSDGFIHVYSEPNRGTTFKIYLPAIAEPAPQKSDSHAGLSVRGTETILLVEDEEGVRRLALMSLQKHGYHVLTAVDGRDALRVVGSHSGPIDLILTDVVMPNLSGPELVRELRGIRPKVCVLFMSGYTDDAVVRHGILEADVAFIQKPYTPMRLARKVRDVLDERKSTIWPRGDG